MAALASKHGRVAVGKIAILGILKLGGKVFAIVVDDTKTSMLLPMLIKKLLLQNGYTGNYFGYQTLDVSIF